MNWFSDSIPNAISEAKKKNKVFLVYIEGNDEMSKKMTITYNDPVISKKLTGSDVVALKLVANSQPYLQFSAIYPVLVIPSSFFIGKNGTPVEIITGNLEPSDFLKKINNVFEIHEKDCANSIQTNANEQPSKSSEEAATSSTMNSICENRTESYSTECAGASEVPSTSSVSSSGSDESSKEALQDKVERAKSLLEIKRQNKAAEENEKDKQEEIDRRNTGKAMQQAQKTKQENELQEWAKNRAKDKEEERLAREKVRSQIAQDRAERAAKYQQAKEAEQAERERMSHMREEQDRAARDAAMRSNDARLQFRLPDGSFTSHTFSADSPLEEARQFVTQEVRPPFSNFTLCTTFPRRHFIESNYSESLRDLQLAPSAVILVLPAQAVTNINASGGFLSSLFWMLMSPFTSIWRLITSFFPGSPTPAPSPPTDTDETQQHSSGMNNQSGATNDSQAAHQQREANFYKREGNVFRINNQSDDDDNNTWNGNSTQQM